MDKKTDSHDDTIDHEELEITDEEGQSTTEKNKIKQLRDKLSEAEAAKRELHEELQRTKADFLNSKRRLEEQQRAAVSRTEDALLSDLLPLADSFAMAMKDTEAWEAIDEAWRKGVEGIHAQLSRILSAHNVTAVDPVGETFDPEEHDAVGTAAGDTPDTVVEVVQVGYKRGDAVLRPAKVIISG